MGAGVGAFATPGRPDVGGGGGGGAGLETGGEGFGRSAGVIGCVGAAGCSGALVIGGAGGATVAPQKPQNLLLGGRGFRHLGHVTCRAGAGDTGGAEAASPSMAFPHREHVKADAGLGVPQDVHRIYRMVPCSLASSGITPSSRAAWDLRLPFRDEHPDGVSIAAKFFSGTTLGPGLQANVAPRAT